MFNSRGRGRRGRVESYDGTRQTTLTGGPRPFTRLQAKSRGSSISTSATTSRPTNQPPPGPTTRGRGRGRGSRGRGRGGRYNSTITRAEQEDAELKRIFGAEDHGFGFGREIGEEDDMEDFEDRDPDQEMYADWREYAGTKRLKFEDGFADNASWQWEMIAEFKKYPGVMWEIRRMLTEMEPDEDENGFPKSTEREMEERFGHILDILYFQTEPEDPLKTLFSGVCIYVNGFTQPTAGELQLLMQLTGGAFTWNYQAGKTTHTIATVMSVAQRKQERSRLTTLRPEWILDCIEARKVLPIHEYKLIKPKNDIKKMFQRMWARAGQVEQAKVNDQVHLKAIPEEAVPQITTTRTRKLSPLRFTRNEINFDELDEELFVEEVTVDRAAHAQRPVMKSKARGRGGRSPELPALCLLFGSDSSDIEDFDMAPSKRSPTKQPEAKKPRGGRSPEMNLGSSWDWDDDDNMNAAPAAPAPPPSGPASSTTAMDLSGPDWPVKPREVAAPPPQPVAVVPEKKKRYYSDIPHVNLEGADPTIPKPVRPDIVTLLKATRTKTSSSTVTRDAEKPAEAKPDQAGSSSKPEPVRPTSSATTRETKKPAPKPPPGTFISELYPPQPVRLQEATSTSTFEAKLHLGAFSTVKTPYLLPKEVLPKSKFAVDPSHPALDTISIPDVTREEVAKSVYVAAGPPVAFPSREELLRPEYRLKSAGGPPSVVRLLELKRKLTRPDESHYVPVEGYIPKAVEDIDPDVFEQLPEDVQRELKGYARYEAVKKEREEAAKAPKTAAPPAVVLKKTGKGKKAKATAVAPEPAPSGAGTIKSMFLRQHALAASKLRQKVVAPVIGHKIKADGTRSVVKMVGEYSSPKELEVVVGRTSPKASTSSAVPSNQPGPSTSRSAGQPRLDALLKTREASKKKRQHLPAFIRALELFEGKFDRKLGRPHLCGQQSIAAISRLVRAWFLTELNLLDDDLSYLLKYFASLIDSGQHEELVRLLRCCKEWLAVREARGGLEMETWKVMFYETFAAFFAGEEEAFRKKIPEDLFDYPTVEVVPDQGPDDDQDPEDILRLMEVQLSSEDSFQDFKNFDDYEDEDDPPRRGSKRSSTSAGGGQYPDKRARGAEDFSDDEDEGGMSPEI